MVKGGGSIDPKKFSEEVFELFSIPAFDTGAPEIVKGSEIGSTKKCVEPNDVLLSKIVPHIRRCLVVPKIGKLRQIASGEWIQFRSEKLIPDYLRFFLISNIFHSQFMSTVKGVGGSLLRASPSQVANIKIPLITLDQQQKIAAILDAAYSLRKKDKQLVAHYTALSQSLFLEMFGDPVTNPMRWDCLEFGTIGNLDRGKSKHRPRNDPVLLGGNYPLIQTGDVANCDGHIRHFSSTYSDIGLRQSKIWKAGTLCITIAANIAKTGILDFDSCFPDSVVGFIPNKKTNIEYVQHWLSFLQKILEDSAPMAAQKNINLKILRGLVVPLPPIELQNQFAERIQFIETQKQQAQASLEKSEALFNSLLQRAFTGELTAKKAA